MAAPPEIARQNGRLGGRPKGSLSKKTLLKQKIEEQLIEEAQKHVPGMLQALVDAAQGVWVEVRKDGKAVRVYRKAPEVQAIKEYFDRIMGKSTQSVEVEGNLGLDLSILDDREAELAKRFINDNTSKRAARLAGSTKNNKKPRKKTAVD